METVTEDRRHSLKTGAVVVIQDYSFDTHGIIMPTCQPSRQGSSHVCTGPRDVKHTVGFTMCNDTVTEGVLVYINCRNCREARNLERIAIWKGAIHGAPYMFTIVFLVGRGTLGLPVTGHSFFKHTTASSELSDLLENNRHPGNANQR